jgi:hypothetical protein
LEIASLIGSILSIFFESLWWFAAQCVSDYNREFLLTINTWLAVLSYADACNGTTTSCVYSCHTSSGSAASAAPTGSTTIFI